MSQALSFALRNGGWRNRIINGAFNVWQRGTYFNVAGKMYTADRWLPLRAQGVGGMVAQQATYGGPDSVYAMRITRSAGDAQSQGIILSQSLESLDVKTMKGKTFTLSFSAICGGNYSGAGMALSANAAYGTGSDGNMYDGFTSHTLLAASAAVLNSATVQRFSMTFTVPTNATQFGISFGYTPTGVAGAADWFEISNVQLEEGSVATPFEQRPIGLELLLCQRYYAAIGNIHWATLVAANQYLFNPIIRFPQTMRVTPTISVTDSDGNGNSINGAVIDLFYCGAEYFAVRNTNGTSLSPYPDRYLKYTASAEI